MLLDKCYSSLIVFASFEERLAYLKLNGVPCHETFGGSRHLNQSLYHSDEWHDIRDKIIVRDDGNDLGIPGRPILGRIYIHHINPISLSDLKDRNFDILLNPENLICTSFETHNLIHYGDMSQRPKFALERKPNDTCPWRN